MFGFHSTISICYLNTGTPSAMCECRSGPVGEDLDGPRDTPTSHLGGGRGVTKAGAQCLLGH